MVKRSELKRGVPVRINRNFKHTNQKAWMSSILTDNLIEYAYVFKFHDSVKEAIEVHFKWQGERNYSYMHYKDLTVVEDIPKIKKESVLFDENNLDI